ncbi:CGNR zinc finger domain-containing protein [Streptomyces sp. NPDC000410]|uniref:CGNR zinc finger domain-containing protein n=1 Tax=Streptomyces sp. NPDC000410 TaxID=3154254 RepID=UPI003327267A
MPPSIEADPRPLTGEPLSIDLLNTRWVDADCHHDLLESLGGLTVWLSGTSVRRALGERPLAADRATLERLRQARAALDAVATDPARPPGDAVAALNAVLAHGRVRRLLRPDGVPDTDVEVDAPFWLPAWAACENWLRLVADRPGRIRCCANPECPLHFFDVSKNGTRRWCSMSGCGNRAKAQRHYERGRRP